MNEQKVGLTTINWVLSILGILVLSCFIILPPVFRSFMKAEEIIEEPPKVEVKSGTTICQNDNINAVGYNDSVMLSFFHQDYKIKSFTKNTLRTYYDPLVYQIDKLDYGKYVTAFSIIAGYEYSATPNDDMSSISISEVYNLTNFKPTTIVIPGDENPIAITTDYRLDDNISNVKEYLTATGFICVEND